MKRGQRGGIFFRLLFLMLFLCLLALLFAGRRPLMRFAGQFWVIDEPAAKSDALIVLGDDNYAGDRAFHAAELYREKVAPVVVASGRMLRRNSSVAEVMQHDLQSFGVPAESIVALSLRAQNTREGAEEVARLIRARGWKRVVIVTSNYQARRARFIYGRVFPPSVTVRVSAARDSEFDPSNWWQTRQGQNLFFNELTGYLVARWELRGRPARENESSFLISQPEHEGPDPDRFSTDLPLPYRIGNTHAMRWSPCVNAATIVFSLPLSPSCHAPGPALGLRRFRSGEK